MQRLVFAKRNVSHLSRKVPLSTNMSTKHSSNIILVQMVFGNLETGGNVLLGEQWFPPCYPPVHTSLVQCFLMDS